MEYAGFECNYLERKIKKRSPITNKIKLKEWVL